MISERMAKVQLSLDRGYCMGPGPEIEWEISGMPRIPHHHPATFSPGLGRIPSEQGGLGNCGPHLRVEKEKSLSPT